MLRRQKIAAVGFVLSCVLILLAALEAQTGTFTEWTYTEPTYGYMRPQLWPASQGQDLHI